MCRFCEPVDKSSLLLIKEENYPINIRKDKLKQALYLDTMSSDKPEYIYSTDVGPLTPGDLHIEANFCMYCGRRLREQ